MSIWSSEINELEKLYESFKGQLPDLEKELAMLIKTEDSNVILLYSRRCLEVIITDICKFELKRDRGSEPLKGIIDKLNKEKKIPANIIASMHGLNELSTFGTHPKDFDPEQVKPVLVNLNIIIKWYLKNKEAGTEIKTKPSEEIGKNTTIIENIKKRVPKKTMMGLISGLVVVILLLVGVLLIPDIIGWNKLEKSIAVLPFENWNSDQEYLHLGDAITDEIILQLQNMNAFDRVLSRSSTMQFKGNRPTIPEIAKKLGVNYIIEGSIQRQKDNVTIRVQVIRAKKENHIWGNKYDGKWEKILDFQNDISKKVAAELKVALNTSEIERIEKKPTENMEAFNQYLLGKFYFSRSVPESFKAAIKHFETAIEMDSTFALAYVYLTYMYQFMVRYNWLKPEVCYQQARYAIFKAIELDNNLGEAYGVLGLYKIVFNWDIYGPEEDFRKALKLSPNSSEIYAMYTQYLRWLGRYDEGITMAKKAIELDPLNPNTSIWLETIYFYSGRYDEAINHLNQMLVIDSSYIMTYIHLAYNYTLKEDYEQALKYADISMSKGDMRNNAMFASTLGWVYAKSGEKEKAIDILNRFKDSPDALGAIAMIYYALGDKEKFFDSMNKAIVEHNGMMLYMKAFSDSYFKDLNSDPRFIYLLKKIGFRVN